MTLMETAQLLGNLGEFFGAFAVLITLVYLAFQVRQNTVSAAAATDYAYVNAYDAVVGQSAENSDVATLHRAGLFSPDELDDDQHFQWVKIMARHFNFYDTMFSLHRRGLLSDMRWNVLKVDIQNILGTPGGKRLWDETGTGLDPHMIAEINSWEPLTAEEDYFSRLFLRRDSRKEA